MKIGICARSDNTGLGYQSRALVEMLHPDKILLIDSSSFKDIKQHPEWYQGYNIVKSDGIPGFKEYEEFLKDLDVMITAETPYTYEAWNWAKLAGVKTFCQPNWELFDGLIQPNMPHPDQYWMPSYWHLEDMQKLFPNTVYLPPPTLPFTREHGKKTNRRFVHIVGANAIYDRNGWSNLMDALPLTKSDFELVVYSQQDMTGLADPRVKYTVMDVEEQSDMYMNFDALILPRRYGGLCLPMNEALTAGLPVIMPNISPNDKLLPDEWLLPAYQSASFEGRSIVDVFSVDPAMLAEIIDDWCAMEDDEIEYYKGCAKDLSKQFSMEVLRPQYIKLLTAMLSQ